MTIISRYFILLAVLFGMSQYANGEACPTTNSRGEKCISATPSVETDGDWTTYRESLENSCDCTCWAKFTGTDGVAKGSIVKPHDKDSVICLNVRGKGCSGFEREFTFTCQREGADANPDSSPVPKRTFSKDQCRDEACANSAFEMTENWELTNAAKAICDRQYLQCLQDGREKPDFQQALRIAREAMPREVQPAPPPVPQQRQAAIYQGQNFGEMIDCFFDPIYKDKGGVPICLAKNPIDGAVANETMDVVNGRQAYICPSQGWDDATDFYYRRKSEYGGGRSW